MVRYLPVIVILALYIYSIIDCLRSEPADVRSISKPLWMVVIVLLPVIGWVLWYFLGRPQYEEAASAPSSRMGPLNGGRGPGPVAPDDDPEFLRNLAIRRHQQEEAEKLRKLKEELDAREARLKDQHPDNGAAPKN
ncbi:PLD nuclease N-terminal domain-containing protein [Arthrobacter sp. 35W]|uniref:PLD nuclease N-terminal domain-containing protein n=1 Tax=Arthrobacter sp. 35W TaxID=1132441 RepID=UPI00041AE526|nr:PLD nuclease N-terminal domain-containing protein [Arthrobacter sp. 35W]